MRSDRATLDEETPQWVVEMEKLPLEQRMFPHLEGTGAVDFHRRPPTPAGAKLLMDVEYGEHGKLLYAYGRADGSERRPVVVLLHGGGWRFGTPFMCVRYAADLAALGYVTVCPQYRFSTDAIWPAQLEDARAAVAWVRANASRLGCDPERM
ncbi:MAG TPA: alpha/beta hydrolase fold domain-containing protein, partial [Candidatus Dormibacteraeota bacterium]|nr:alpha/beta hydrolase fold domain-containing protein [Candidatus Dormibacteraeota bacterium]